MPVFSYSDKQVSFSVPDGYTELTAANIKNHEEELNLLGYSEDSFKKYLEKNNILFIAINDDNTSQITLREYGDGLSFEISDLDDYSDSDIDILAKSLVPKNSLYYKVSVNGTKYMQIISKNTDSGGAFCSVNYLTVKNGTFYSLLFNYSESSLSKENLDNSFNAINALLIKADSPSGNWSFTDILLFIGAMILLFLLIAVIITIIWFFIVDIIKKRKERAGGGVIKVKRRKF